MTKSQLLKLHPAKIKGIPVEAIIDLADPEDYDLLAGKEMFIAFTHALVSSRTIPPPYQDFDGQCSGCPEQVVEQSSTQWCWRNE